MALVAAGCGGDDEETSGQSTTKQETSASGGGGKATSVSMKNIQFQPAEVDVPKGGTVKWTNDESVGHDVTKTSGPGAKFSSGDPGAMQSGDTFQQKFDSPGTVQYVCTVHSNMKGSVTVK
jgi:plastocyanin